MATEEMVKTKIDVDIDIKEPKKYNVIFLNDDRTTFEFVISVLLTIYGYGNVTDAYNKASEIHEKGKAIVGSYTKEVAETKQEITRTLAEANGYPLKVEIEPE